MYSLIFYHPVCLSWWWRWWLNRRRGQPEKQSLCLSDQGSVHRLGDLDNCEFIGNCFDHTILVTQTDKWSVFMDTGCSVPKRKLSTTRWWAILVLKKLYHCPRALPLALLPRGCSAPTSALPTTSPPSPPACCLPSSPTCTPSCPCPPPSCPSCPPPRCLCRTSAPPCTTCVVVLTTFAWCHSLLELSSSPLWLAMKVPSSTSLVKGFLYDLRIWISK